MGSARAIGAVVVLLVAADGARLAAATADSPAGLWRTTDDTTGKDRSLVRIAERDGRYEGKVEKILITLPDDDPNHLCRHCTGDLKDQPIVGMTILWGLTKSGDDTYTGGEILDPKNGKTYSAKVTLEDGGRKLDVRGFIGFSLIGRSQTWVRQE
jgi:uncharacterized protein (DUF2147 family)